MPFTFPLFSFGTAAAETPAAIKNLGEEETAGVEVALDPPFFVANRPEPLIWGACNASGA